MILLNKEIFFKDITVFHFTDYGYCVYPVNIGISWGQCVYYTRRILLNTCVI